MVGNAQEQRRWTLLQAVSDGKILRRNHVWFHVAEPADIQVHSRDADQLAVLVEHGLIVAVAGTAYPTEAGSTALHRRHAQQSRRGPGI